MNISCGWRGTAGEAMTVPHRVLFVCVGNACRSQIAEALARRMAPDLLEVSSAGLSPLGRIPEATRIVLQESGISLDGQFSKGLDDASVVPADFIVNLTGISGASLFSASRMPGGSAAAQVPSATILDWDVYDPYGDDEETYRRVRDDIESRLREWIAAIRTEHDAVIEAAADALEDAVPYDAEDG
jgi:arsenate reductase